MNLDDVVAELLSGSLNEFTNARNAKAKELQAAGQREEAAVRGVQEMLRLATVSGGETWDRLQRGALISEPRAGEDMLTAAFALGSAGSGVKAAPRVEASEARAARTAAREAAETEKRIEMEHVLRTAKADEEAAQHAGQTAHRLREEA